MVRRGENDRIPLIEAAAHDEERDDDEHHVAGSVNRLGDLLGGATRDVEATAPPPPTETDKKMKDFFEWVGDIKHRMKLFAENTKEIERRHTAALTAIASNPKGVQALEDLMDETQEIARNIRSQLKQLESENAKLEDQGMNSQLRIRTNMHNTLSRKFCELMKSYQEGQEKFKQAYKDRVERQYRIVNPQATSEDVKKLVEGDQDIGGVFALSQMNLNLQEEVANIKEKHAEILKLEQSIVELHQLFMDMSVMVEQQGELLNTIEYSVEQSAQYVEEANEQLILAKKHQKSARKKMFCILCCLICLLVITLGVLKGVLSTYGIM